VNEESVTSMVVGLLLCLMIVIFHSQCSPARAQAEQLTEQDKLVLAQALVGEADWSQVDHAAIAWVLQKRWQLYLRNNEPVSFAQFVRMYCSPLKTRSPRAKAIQALPWGPARGPWGGKRWDRVRTWVERWADGRVTDPCPRAMHWGGTMDRPYGHWAPVSCGKTRNIFYTVRTSGGQS
jgi:hypothetical protein